MAATSFSSVMDTSSKEALRRLQAYESGVCRIVLKDGKRNVSKCGTAFLIAPDLAMACHHEIPDIATAEKCEFHFLKTQS